MSLTEENPLAANAADLTSPAGIASRRRARRALAWPIVLAATITWCSGRAAVDIGMQWLSPDKFAHFAVYGCLATAVARIGNPGRRSALTGLVAFLLTSAYGLGDEFRQSFTLMRQYDLLDWAADTAGAAVAAMLYVNWTLYRRWLEHPVRPKRDNRQVEISPEPVPNSSA